MRRAPDAALAALTSATEFLHDVETHVLEVLDAREPRTGELIEAARAHVVAGGKRLRPLLVRAALPGTVGALARHDRSRVLDASVHAAAAVELLHTASLVHDDLLDGAQLRRGVPTIDARIGRSGAVAAGDLLFSLAFATLVDARRHVGDVRIHDATRALAHTARALAIGEALQAQQLRDVALTESAYLERCAGKTGVLFGASLQLGAIVGGAAPEDVAQLARFGVAVGTAFQVADDVLDCGDAATADILGKAPGADVRDGTITLPMLHAFRLDPELTGALAERVAEGDVAAMLERIRTTGALDTARHRAIELRDESLALLESLEDRFDTNGLREIARRSVDRLS